MPLYRLTEAQAAEVRFILTKYAPPEELRESKRRLRVQLAALKNLQQPAQTDTLVTLKRQLAQAKRLTDIWVVRHWEVVQELNAIRAKQRAN